jgi:hypothetical protein
MKVMEITYLPDNLMLKPIYIQSKEIDPVKWDMCIQNASNEMIYAYTDYLNITAENYDALVLGDYEAVMPLIWKRKAGLKYIYQPFFTQQSGVFSSGLIDANLCSLFLFSIPRTFIKVNMNLNWLCSFNLKNTFLKHNFVLDLSVPYPFLLKNYHSKARSHISKAQSNELILKKEVDTSEFISFKRENTKIRISESTWLILRQLIDHFRSLGKVSIYGVYDKNKLISATAWFYSKKRVYYLVSANNQKGLQTRASWFLVDSFIRSECEKPLVLDFEGSNIPGVAQFFKAWGANDQPYATFKRNLFG